MKKYVIPELHLTDCENWYKVMFLLSQMLTQRLDISHLQENRRIQ